MLLLDGELDALVWQAVLEGRLSRAAGTAWFATGGRDMPAHAGFDPPWSAAGGSFAVDLTDEQALDAIARELDGTEWGADTLERVAELVRRTSREVRDVDDVGMPEPVRPDGPETDRGGLIGQEPY